MVKYLASCHMARKWQCWINLSLPDSRLSHHVGPFLPLMFLTWVLYCPFLTGPLKMSPRPGIVMIVASLASRVWLQHTVGPQSLLLTREIESHFRGR